MKNNQTYHGKPPKVGKNQFAAKQGDRFNEKRARPFAEIPTQ